jgi:hypothetical protein
MDFAPNVLLERSRLAILVLAIVTPACTASDDSNRVAVDPAPEILIPDGAADRLAGAVRIATISHADTSAFDDAAFNALRPSEWRRTISSACTASTSASR